MPLPELERLDLAYYRAQRSNAASTAALIYLLWQQNIRADDIAGSGQRWLELAIQAILTGRQKSSQLAIANSTVVRRLVAPTLPPPRVLIPTPNLEQIRGSLEFTGLVKAAQKLNEIPQREEVPDDASSRTPEGLKQEALQEAGRAAAAASVRHVQNGGREVTDELIRTDRLVVGYVRIPLNEKPCYFCAALASRGPVYEEDSFDLSDPRFHGPGDHKVHDNCNCVLREVYSRRRDEWPSVAAQFADLWEASTASVSGGGKMLAFRRAYEGREAA